MLQEPSENDKIEDFKAERHLRNLSRVQKDLPPPTYEKAQIREVEQLAQTHTAS